MQQIRVIAEPDVFRLVFGSQLPSALQFEAWVVDEVLPAIGRTGGYMVSRPEETPAELMARAVLLARRRSPGETRGSPP